MRDRSDRLEYQADAGFHGLGGAIRERTPWAGPHQNPFCKCGLCGACTYSADPHGVTGRNPGQGVIITLGATSASVPRLRGGFNWCTVVAATKRVGHVQCPMPCTV